MGISSGNIKLYSCQIFVGTGEGNNYSVFQFQPEPLDTKFYQRFLSDKHREL